MLIRTSIAVLVVSVLYAGTCGAQNTDACSKDLAREVPARRAEAPSGSEFIRRLAGLTDDERETAIREALLSGNLPSFLRELHAVLLNAPAGDSAARRVVVCVTPDYLAVGSDRNYFLTPMRLQTALAVAMRFHFMLPTPKIVDAIYAQAGTHLEPRPLPPGDTMRTTAYYAEHDQLVHLQRADVGSGLGDLIAGDKKDLVLTNRLWNFPDRVAIYGWHRPDGSRIQPLSTVHGWRYADYSHGVRLISDTAYVNGEPKRLLDLLQDPSTAVILSGEGQIHNPSGLVSMLGRHRERTLPQS
ncbi:MAG: hypothetical protein JSR66_26295 [Proteobacteria bacterium]|nr:hypothetical protein [Pseudomonadota bacterium]